MFNTLKFNHSLNSDYLEENNQLLPSKIKKEFIKKIYSLLSLQLITTCLMSYLFYRSETITNFVLNTPGALIASILGTFIFLFLSWCYGKNYPYNYFILTGFTLCESYTVSYVCLFYQLTSILMAWGLITSIFVCLSIYTIITKKDFKFIGAGLFAYLWIIIIGVLIQIIWLPNDLFLNTAMAIIGAVTVSGYILYDTSEIINRLDPEDFVYACMNLYLDIIMLFLQILELFGDKRD